MNRKKIESNWQAYKSDIRQQWNKLMDDQLYVIAGEREYLVNKLKIMYGIR